MISKIGSLAERRFYKVYRYLKNHPTTFIILGIGLMMAFFVTNLLSVTTYLVLAGLLAYLCVPMVEFMCKFKIHRSLAIFIIFIIVVTLFLLLFSILIPKLISQIVQFVKELPMIYDTILKLVEQQDTKLFQKFDLESYLMQYRSNLVSISTKLLNMISQKAQGFGFSLIFIPLLFYYFLRDYDHFPELIDSVFPASRIPEVREFFEEYNRILSSYFRGQVIIALMVAVASWITLTLFRVKFAIVIAILGGVLNFVPVLGPIIASIPAIFLALLNSPLTALLVGIILFFINQITSVIIFPSLISKQVKLSPVVIIVAVLAAGNMMGAVGVLLVLPLIIMFKLYWINFIRPQLDDL